MKKYWKMVKDFFKRINRWLLIACFSAISSAVAWYSARQAANYANQISDRQLQIEENRKLNENKEKSLAFIEEFYSNIRNNPIYWDFISNDNLISFVDEFEWLWWKYCQEQIYKWDLQLYSPIFRKICLNDMIVKKYWWSKNAFSKICLDLVWNQWMWAYYKDNAICNVLK